MTIQINLNYDFSNQKQEGFILKTLIALLALGLTIGAQAKTSFSVMNYNAENFFDTKHDAGTDDYTYISLAEKKQIPGHAEICQKMGSSFYVKECLNLDWNEARFMKKVENISRVIRSYDNTGAGPDILILQEVENLNVLNQLAAKGLRNLGYNYRVLIEGDDARGIDVGVMSKYPVIRAQHHSIFVNGQKLDTRGITEVAINVEGRTVIVFGNHWPSQSNPAQDRIAAAELLTNLAASRNADLIFATGDFNTVETDRPYPFNFLKGFINAETEARKINRNLNPGTHYYKGSWTSLDRMWIHQNSRLAPNFGTFQIMVRDFLMKREGQAMVPMRFNHASATGFSDHLGIGMDFKL